MCHLSLDVNFACNIKRFKLVVYTQCRCRWPSLSGNEQEAAISYPFEAPLSFSLRGGKTLGMPGGGSKVWKAAGREIGRPGENREKIIAHWEMQPTAAFHDRENRCNPRSPLWAADVQPPLPIPLGLRPSSPSGCPCSRSSASKRVPKSWQLTSQG